MSDLAKSIKDFFKQSWQGLKLLPNFRKSQIPTLFESFNKHDAFKFTAFAALFIIAGGFLVYGSLKKDYGLPTYGGEISEGIIGQPRFLNPVLSPASLVDSDVSRIFFSRLVKFDNSLNLVPDLAESLPQISDDQKSYTFKLKQNLKWDDGKPLRADDVVYTVALVQNENYQSPLRTAWTRVRVEKVDDYTVTFRLPDVSSPFITTIAQLGILPKHVWENVPASNFSLSELNLNPVGSGPFSFREIKKASDGTIKTIVLKANPYYYQGRPFLDRITFNFYPDVESLVAAFQAKEIQAMGYVPYDKKASENLPPNYNQMMLDLPQYQAMFFNLKNSVLSDKSVRQALWLATDRDPIIKDVYLGLAKPAYGPILEGNLGFDPKVKEVTHFNLDEARSILDKAGWAIDSESGFRLNAKTKKQLEFTIVSSNNILYIKTAKLVQEQWSKLNANVHLSIVSPTDLEEQYIRPRAFDVLLFGENTGADPDPFPFWHSTQARDPYFNLTGFSDANADRLLNQGRQTNDSNVRSQAYVQFQSVYLDQLPAVFLTSTVYVYEVPKKLKGLHLSTITHQSERFQDVARWYVNTK